MTADPEYKDDETDDDTHPGECGSGSGYQIYAIALFLMQKLTPAPEYISISDCLDGIFCRYDGLTKKTKECFILAGPWKPIEENIID